MSLYETKMPAYLAMSRGDLIAEILAAGDPAKAHLEAVEAAMLEDDGEIPAPTPAQKDAFEIVRIANSVLKERFGVTIEFHYTSEEL